MTRRACSGLTCFFICVLQLLITDTGARISVAPEESFARRLSARSAITREMVWIVLPKPISSASIPPEASAGFWIEKLVAIFVNAFGI